MQVFNRWGSLVYSSGTLPASNFGSGGWDGFYKNQKAEQGVYVYVIEVEFIDNRKFLYRGDVTLVR